MFGEKKATERDIDHLTFKVHEIDKEVKKMPTEVDFVSLLNKIISLEEKVNELKTAELLRVSPSYARADKELQ